MQITLTETDLDSAIQTYIEKLGMNLDDKTISVNYTAGRGPNGNTATIDITNGVVKPSPVKVEAAEVPAPVGSPFDCDETDPVFKE